MATHELKTWPEYFSAIVSGRKKFEIRDGRDRMFRIGDELVLREYDPRPGGGYTGRKVHMYATYIHYGPGFGLTEHAVVMSLEPRDTAG